jgi:hypothetical protein
MKGAIETEDSLAKALEEVHRVSERFKIKIAGAKRRLKSLIVNQQS